MPAALGVNDVLLRSQRHRSRAFTLVELLVVTGIIVVLAGLLAAAIRHLHRVAAAKETLAELHVCRGLLQEYEGRNGLAGIEAYSTTNPLQLQDPNAPAPGVFPVFVDPWSTFDAVNAPNYTRGDQSAIGTYWPSYEITDVVPGAGITVDATGAGRYSCNAVQCTSDVMYLLMRVPANRTTIQSIPPKQLFVAQAGQAAPTIDQGPILLDGWGNPIIFVPRGGLHVTMPDPNTGATLTYVVRSTGIIPFTGTEPLLTGNERPFWASAGEDGDFTNGADNLYSFQD